MLSSWRVRLLFGQLGYGQFHAFRAAGDLGLGYEGIEGQAAQGPAAGIEIQQASVQQAVGHQQGVAGETDIGGVGTGPETGATNQAPASRGTAPVGFGATLAGSRAGR